MPEQKENKDRLLDTRSAKAMIGTPGGNASKGSRYYKVNIPPKWTKAMGISPEERDLILSFDGETITIRKKSTEEGL